MTPPPQPSHVRWFGRSDDDPNRLLIIEDEHSKVFLDAELREELYAAILGCASHSSAPPSLDIGALKKSIIEVLDTGFESSERDMELVLDRIAVWETNNLGVTEQSAKKPVKNCMCDKYTNCTDCFNHDQSIRQDERKKVLTERNIKALERVIGFAFSYRPQLSEESQEDIKIADDLYHELKTELRTTKQERL
jgi:hypothetical protein